MQTIAHLGQQEFLDGCLRLKGMARSIDVHFIMVPGLHLGFRVVGVMGLAV